MIRVLVISYYWPPAGGPGVQRVLKFAKYLSEFDFQPVILTVDSGDYPVLDETLIDDISPLISVYKVQGWEPYRLYKRFTGKKLDESIPVGILSLDAKRSPAEFIANWVRLNLFIPDARRFLVKPFVKRGLEIIREKNIHVIVTSSPPQSMHLVGLELKKRTGIPWIADFRDPWTSIYYYQNSGRMKFAKKRDLRLEKRIINHTDCLTTAHRLIIDDLSSRYNPVETALIYNGYDEDDFVGISPKSMSENTFTILYYGTLAKDQTIPGLEDVFSNIIDKVSNSKRKVVFKFIGNICDPMMQKLKKKIPSENMEFMDYLPHKELLKEAMSASALLLIIPNVPDSKGIIPGKLFEYLALGIPVIGIGPPDGEAAGILSETGAGLMAECGDEKKIMKFIEDNLSSPDISDIGRDVSKFSRRNQTKKLAKVIKKVMDNANYSAY